MASVCRNLLDRAYSKKNTEAAEKQTEIEKLKQIEMDKWNDYVKTESDNILKDGHLVSYTNWISLALTIANNIVIAENLYGSVNRVYFRGSVFVNDNDHTVYSTNYTNEYGSVYVDINTSDFQKLKLAYRSVISRVLIYLKQRRTYNWRLIREYSDLIEIYIG
jgi:hypothetical protein